MISREKGLAIFCLVGKPEGIRLLPHRPSSVRDGGASANFQQWDLGRLSVSSLATVHLPCLFADLPRVNDEFERIRILIFFDQLEVDGGSMESAQVVTLKSGQQNASSVVCCTGQRPSLHGPPGPCPLP